MKRRIAAKYYPESTDMVETGFPVLTDICSNSHENLALLFTEDGWYHLERIYRKHPLKTLHFLKEVFDKNKSLLYIDLTIFERIFVLYRSFSKRIFAKKKVREIQTDNGILIFVWNTLMAEILKIDTSKIPLPKVIHLYFKVQQVFDEDLISFIFQYIINPQGLV